LDAVVLAGGQGRRVRSVTQSAKCLLPVRGRPALDHVIDWLLTWPEADRVWIAAGFAGEAVSEHVRRAYSDVRVSVEVEPSPLGTLGALVRLAPRLSSEVVVVNGDTLLQGDLGAMARQHASSPAQVTVAAVAQGRRDAGAMKVETLPGPVRRVARGYLPGATAFSAGLYVMDRAVFAHARCPGSLEQDLIPPLVAECRGLVWAYPWFSAVDIGTPSRYRAVNRVG
jgi:NDP-sugar pyrophosphorylase family protein